MHYGIYANRTVLFSVHALINNEKHVNIFEFLRIAVNDVCNNKIRIIVKISVLEGDAFFTTMKQLFCYARLP
jgi:hypothetical protein